MRFIILLNAGRHSSGSMSTDDPSNGPEEWSHDSPFLLLLDVEYLASRNLMDQLVRAPMPATPQQYLIPGIQQV